jgi:high-affinity iron transporter
VILTGKGVHSFQETGIFSVSTPPFVLHFDLLGLYPTWETIVAQIAVLATVLILWSYGKKSHGASFDVEVTDS